MFMQIYVFVNRVKDMGAKQKFISSTNSAYDFDARTELRIVNGDTVLDKHEAKNGARWYEFLNCVNVNEYLINSIFFIFLNLIFVCEFKCFNLVVVLLKF